MLVRIFETLLTCFLGQDLWPADLAQCTVVRKVHPCWDHVDATRAKGSHPLKRQIQPSGIVVPLSSEPISGHRRCWAMVDPSLENSVGGSEGAPDGWELNFDYVQDYMNIIIFYLVYEWLGVWTLTSWQLRGEDSVYFYACDWLSPARGSRPSHISTDMRLLGSYKVWIGATCPFDISHLTS